MEIGVTVQMNAFLPVQQQQYDGPVNDDYNQRLSFPSLTPKQKQFAVNPGLEEFRAADPDFLQYRLEELDEAEPSNPVLEEELHNTLMPNTSCLHQGSGTILVR